MTFPFRPPCIAAVALAAALAVPVAAQVPRAEQRPHARQTMEQDLAHERRERGEIWSFNALLPRAQRAAGASSYLGVEPDIRTSTYRFKFMRADGRVVWVDMDGRTGRVLAVH